MKAKCWCGRTFEYDRVRPSLCPTCEAQKRAVGQEVPKQYKFVDHHRGWRKINGRRIYFPNRTEANYFRYLLWQKEHGLVMDFEYQPKPFDFVPFGVVRGITSYRPDFRVVDREGKEYFVETKGYVQKDLKTKLNRMRKFYPLVEVRVVLYRDYKDVEGEVANLVPEWER